MFCPINITKNDFVSFHAIKAKPFQQKKTNRKKKKKEKSIRMEFLYPCKHAEILRKFLKRLLFLEHLLFPNIEILLNLELLQFQERH